MEIKKVVVDKETVYLRKNSYLGWKVIYPIKNEDGSINWLNFLAGGSWWNLLIISILVLVIVAAIYEYTFNINILLSCFDDPLKFEGCKEAFGNSAVIINP